MGLERVPPRPPRPATPPPPPNTPEPAEFNEENQAHQTQDTLSNHQFTHQQSGQSTTSNSDAKANVFVQGQLKAMQTKHKNP